MPLSGVQFRQKLGKSVKSIHQRLFDAMVHKAKQVNIEYLCLGLGYTAVTTSRGDLGLAYTYFDHKTACTPVGEYQDFEGRPATELLALIHSANPLERSMALALINALCLSDLAHLPSDRGNTILFNGLGIGPSVKVAMVGYIKPLVALLESKGAAVEVIDEFRSMGQKEAFYKKLGRWADVAIITSTSLLNNSFEEIMAHVAKDVRAALVGPSTPMVAEAFCHWPMIKALAGTVPLENEPILKSVRHGLGTPYLHKYSKKATLIVEVRSNDKRNNRGCLHQPEKG
jgi:uncharacterized protein (DUF4213/DUF364 family)